MPISSVRSGRHRGHRDPRSASRVARFPIIHWADKVGITTSTSTRFSPAHAIN